MEKLERTLVLAQEELTMGHVYYLYKDQEEDAMGKRIIGGVYILQAEIGDNPPKKMNLILEWE